MLADARTALSWRVSLCSFGQPLTCLLVLAPPDPRRGPREQIRFRVWSVRTCRHCREDDWSGHVRAGECDEIIQDPPSRDWEGTHGRDRPPTWSCSVVASSRGKVKRLTTFSPLYSLPSRSESVTTSLSEVCPLSRSSSELSRGVGAHLSSRRRALTCLLGPVLSRRGHSNRRRQGDDPGVRGDVGCDGGRPGAEDGQAAQCRAGTWSASSSPQPLATTADQSSARLRRTPL